MRMAGAVLGGQIACSVCCTHPCHHACHCHPTHAATCARPPPPPPPPLPPTHCCCCCAQSMNTIYGFYGEVRAKYNAVMCDVFRETFNWLPLGYVLAHKVLVVHGGLFSREGVKLDDLRAVDRNRCAELRWLSVAHSKHSGGAVLQGLRQWLRQGRQ